MKSSERCMGQFGRDDRWTFCSKVRSPLSEKGETSSCQTAHNDIVKKRPLTKHCYMSDSLYFRNSD